VSGGEGYFTTDFKSTSTTDCPNNKYNIQESGVENNNITLDPRTTFDGLTKRYSCSARGNGSTQ
jgi:hypothetical protein